MLNPIECITRTFDLMTESLTSDVDMKPIWQEGRQGTRQGPSPNRKPLR